MYTNIYKMSAYNKAFNCVQTTPLQYINTHAFTSSLINEL